MGQAEDLESMARVETDIAAARHELQETVDELADRLDPRKRVEAVAGDARRAADQVAETSRRVLGDLKDMSPDEAVAAARQGADRAAQWFRQGRRQQVAVAAAVGVVLLVLRRHRHSRRRRG